MGAIIARHKRSCEVQKLAPRRFVERRPPVQQCGCQRLNRISDPLIIGWQALECAAHGLQFLVIEVFQR